jgi:hypothetical protein
VEWAAAPAASASRWAQGPGRMASITGSFTFREPLDVCSNDHYSGGLRKRNVQTVALRWMRPAAPARRAQAG